MAKCKECGKSTTIKCPGCNLHVCSTHSHLINHKVYCADCFLNQRKIGLLKMWGSLFGLIALAIIVLYVSNL